MKKSSIILVLLSLMLGAGLLVAGCVSDTTATEQTQASTTALAADAGSQPSGTPQAVADHGDMKAGNTTHPAMSGTVPSGTPPSGSPAGMQAGNMTRPEGTPPSGISPSGTPPSGTPPTGTP